ncbi:MAG: DNA repair protein RecO [Gammaproteobacteria bacterium]|nr:DNA repair protein RecO [Gammaproteobacteria bacterium]NNF59788.1 DNA repair protein RecO [Gammaproteobacteria bacterium]NNM20982.1 DNA repair protein RecO [Gammaproteobacteria bacterium]
MQRQRVNLQPAYLLHQRPYRDSSQIVELVTRDHGRIGLVARGARRPRARLRAVLQPFQPLLVSWTARGDLGTLTACEAVTGLPALPPQHANSGYYMNELVVRLTRRHDAHPGLFACYAAGLQGLVHSDSEARVLRLFEKRLLDELGYGLQLQRTAAGESVVGDGSYSYRVEQGIVTTDPVHEHGPVFAGHSLLALAAERLDDDAVLGDVRILLQLALEQHLGPRPLQVRRVARAMRRSLQ